MTVSDFSGVDFDLALGEVYGIRAWRMDDHGRLHAKAIDTAKPWRPGVNVATCHATPAMSTSNLVDPTGRGRKAVAVQVHQDPNSIYDRLQAMPFSRMLYNLPPYYRIQWDDGTESTEREITLESKKDETHTSPVESCKCGFYAYTSAKHAETKCDRYNKFVLGIVKGTGRTLIGTKGFRVEKAEIIALLDPTRAGRKRAEWRTDQLAKLQRVYPDVPLLPSRADLLAFAPIEPQLPDPSTDEFWELP